MILRLTVNQNSTVHAADRYGTICGSELMSARIRVTKYHRLDDTTEVTCQRCIAIIAARLKTGGATGLTSTTPHNTTQGGL